MVDISGPEGKDRQEVEVSEGGCRHNPVWDPSWGGGRAFLGTIVPCLLEDCGYGPFLL